MWLIFESVFTLNQFKYRNVFNKSKQAIAIQTITYHKCICSSYAF